MHKWLSPHPTPPLIISWWKRVQSGDYSAAHTSSLPAPPLPPPHLRLQPNTQYLSAYAFKQSYIKTNYSLNVPQNAPLGVHFFVWSWL